MIADSLKGEYKEVYLKILMYLSSSNVPKEFQHEVSCDIKDLFVNAQNDEMQVKSIIGDDIESFCKEIIKSKKFKNQTLFDIFDSISFALFMAVLGGISLFILKSEMTLNYVVISIVDGLLFRFLLARVLRKAMIKSKGKSKTIAATLIWYILSLIVIGILNYILIINYIVYVDSLYTTILLLIAFIITTIINRKLKNNLRSQCNL